MILKQSIEEMGNHMDPSHGERSHSRRAEYNYTINKTHYHCEVISNLFT